MRISDWSSDVCSSDLRKPDIDENDTYRGGLSMLRFNGPFPELAALSLHLPQDLKDDAGRVLANADQFPLNLQTAAFPPLVKFATAPLGVIERFAQLPAGGNETDAPASVPLTLRNVEAGLATRELAVSAGKVSDYADRKSTRLNSSH